MHLPVCLCVCACVYVCIPVQTHAYGRWSTSISFPHMVPEVELRSAGLVVSTGVHLTPKYPAFKQEIVQQLCMCLYHRGVHSCLCSLHVVLSSTVNLEWGLTQVRPLTPFALCFPSRILSVPFVIPGFRYLNALLETTQNKWFILKISLKTLGLETWLADTEHVYQPILASIAFFFFFNMLLLELASYSFLLSLSFF